MTDHHHLVRSLYEADLGIALKNKYAFAEVQGNLVDLEFRANFLQSMVSKGKIWLYDEQGNAPLNPEFLPDTVEVLANDPHRSLAWVVGSFGGLCVLLPSLLSYSLFSLTVLFLLSYPVLSSLLPTTMLPSFSLLSYPHLDFANALLASELRSCLLIHECCICLLVTKPIAGFQKSDIRYAQFRWAEYFRRAEIVSTLHKYTINMLRVTETINTNKKTSQRKTSC